MDNSKSQSFASGYFSYLQIIKITRMSPEIYLFVPSCIMGVLGSLSFFSGRHKFARETVSEVFPETVPGAVGHNTDPVSHAAPKWLTPPLFVVPGVKKSPASCVTRFPRSVARHVAWQHKHRSIELIAQFFNTVSNVFKKRQRKKRSGQSRGLLTTPRGARGQHFNWLPREKEICALRVSL